jgi:hydrogenase expression/formation protein HypC
MCLAVPVRVVAVLADQWVEAEIGGITSRVSTALIDDVVPGDYLIVHAGFAITRLDVREAELSLALFARIIARQRADDGILRAGGDDAIPARLS